MKRILSTFLIVIIGIGMSACGGPKKQQYTGVDGDFINGTPLPDRVEGSNFFGGSVKRGQYPPIHFMFDSFTLNPEGKNQVRNLAADMKGFRNSIIIAGFTDSRGTEEYNRALGERRAAAVRNALIGLGVGGNRIQTVSFGKEMPADSNENEAAWAKNRRAEIGVIK